MEIPSILAQKIAQTNTWSYKERLVYIYAFVYDPVSIAGLARLVLMNRGSVAKACRLLASMGWMKMIKQKGSLRPVALIPTDCQEVMADALAEQYDMQVNKGEYLMNKRIDWSLRNPEYVTNARPKFLVHPQTGERLEYDRFDPEAMLAVEYNGEQHYRPITGYTREQVMGQMTRDLVKEGLSYRQGVTLLILTWQDLREGAIETVLERHVRHLLKGYVDKKGPYFEALTRICANYAEKAARELAKGIAQGTIPDPRTETLP